jgi:hypothetical protein
MKNITDYIINERRYADKSAKNYSSDYLNIIDKLRKLIGEELEIGISFGDTKISNDYQLYTVQCCAGHVIEAYIATILGGRRSNSENKVHDFNIKNTKFEVKAYKDGKKNNITFTHNQMSKLNSDDIIFIYVDYSLLGNNWETPKVKINDILFGSYNDVKNGKGSVSKHGGKTSNMVSLLQDLDQEAKDLIHNMEDSSYTLTDDDKRIWKTKLQNTLISNTKFALTNPGDIIEFIYVNPCYWQGGNDIVGHDSSLNKSQIINILNQLCKDGAKTTYGIFINHESNRDEYKNNRIIIFDVKDKTLYVPNEKYEKEYESKSYKIIVDKDYCDIDNVIYFAVYNEI